MVKSEVSFQAEYLRDAWPDALILMQEHYEEIPIYKDEKLDPNYESYEKLDDVQALRVYTARGSDGGMAGYCVFIVTKDLHCQSVLVASQQDLFIGKNHRGFGIDFMKWCDDSLSKEGINIVYRSVTPHFDYSNALNRIGYELSGTLYSRRLK